MGWNHKIVLFRTTSGPVKHPNFDPCMDTTRSYMFGLRRADFLRSFEIKKWYGCTTRTDLSQKLALGNDMVPARSSSMCGIAIHLYINIIQMYGNTAMHQYSWPYSHIAMCL